MDEREFEEPDFRPIPSGPFLRCLEAPSSSRPCCDFPRCDPGWRKHRLCRRQSIRPLGRNLPVRKRNAMLDARITRATGGGVPDASRIKARHQGGKLSETINMGFRRWFALLCAASISFVLAGGASAQDKTVKIGAVFPLSGNAASAGVHAKAAIETAMDIINNAHPELGNFPLAKNAGLAGLGGAKVEVIFADNQGSPATGQNQALRLITEEKVVALTGAYQSGITLTTSAIAEKYGIPFVNGESVASNLTDVQSQVLQLKEKKPDVVIMISYTSDASLCAKTFQAQDYKPPMLIA